jgi:hypothetical protein
MPNGRFVSVGLLKQSDLDVIGSGFRRAFPLNKNPDFKSLLTAIDAGDAPRRPPSKCQARWLS